MPSRRTADVWVALIFGVTPDYGSGVLEGITDEGRRRGWQFLDLSDEVDPLRLQTMAAFQGDGVISAAKEPRLNELLVERGIALVSVTTFPVHPEVPHIGHDHRETGRLVARHFVRHGYRRAAYFGHGSLRDLCREHWLGLCEEMPEGGALEPFYEGPRTSIRWSLNDQVADLAEWIDGLPKPMGIMTWDDHHAYRVELACRRCGARVPEDVAVVGTRNGDMVWRLGRPPISSVPVNESTIGRRAATMLAELMTGGRPESARIPPQPIIVRPSSDHFAVEDPDVVEAIAFIREHLSEGVGVEQAAWHLGMSRRTLTRRFTHALGRTPGEEVRYARLERAKRLLAETSMPLADVAAKAGYGYGSYLSQAFKKATGMTPTEYRKQVAPSA